MLTDNPQFSKEVALILRNADRHIRSLSSGSPYYLYHFWRITMAKVCSVDAFYIGFFRNDQSIVYPYTFDGQEYEGVERHHYGEDGMCAWILGHKKPYFYKDDAGKLLNKGQNFGDVTRLSADAVVLPLFEPSSEGLRVTGIASMQTYRPRSYSLEAAHAFQWLAKSVMIALLRNREDAINRRELGFDERLEFHKDPLAAFVEEIGFKLEELRKEAQQVRHLTQEGRVESALQALDELGMTCERIQTDAMEFLVSPLRWETDSLAELTPREKEVALLIAQDLTNEQIATRLRIKPQTVKTHVSNILRKFDVKQRAGVSVILNRNFNP